MAKSFKTVHSGDLDWRDAKDVLTLPEGVQVKVLFQDDATQHIDMLIKFPPGYKEPEHVHEAEHSILVMQGRSLVRGQEMRPGDYVFGPANQPHGPFEYPEGLVVFASFRGGSAHHHFAGSPPR